MSLPRMTDEQRAAWKANRGCPYCSSPNVDYCQRQEADGDTLSERCGCNACHRRWWEIYTLTDVDDDWAETDQGWK